MHVFTSFTTSVSADEISAVIHLEQLDGAAVHLNTCSTSEKEKRRILGPLATCSYTITGSDCYCTNKTMQNFSADVNRSKLIQLFQDLQISIISKISFYDVCVHV